MKFASPRRIKACVEALDGIPTETLVEVAAHPTTHLRLAALIEAAADIAALTGDEPADPAPSGDA